ncbi:unnamed protein product [Echinostoma caproni]|uniref:Uncharacterized protein n=1 Tax=Echinostoma caproni TaxID=27848 RepID=A0A183BEF3_9TREM|nr:unnamed protein product [Echinostoma caproni]
MLLLPNLFIVSGFSLVRPAVYTGYADEAPEIASFYHNFRRTHGLYGTPVNYVFVREMRPTLVSTRAKYGYGPKHAYLSKPKVEYTVITRLVQELRIPVPIKKYGLAPKIGRNYKFERPGYEEQKYRPFERRPHHHHFYYQHDDYREREPGRF